MWPWPGQVGIAESQPLKASSGAWLDVTMLGRRKGEQRRDLGGLLGGRGIPSWALNFAWLLEGVRVALEGELLVQCGRNSGVS